MKKRELVLLICSGCGNRLTCSPGMVDHVLSGKGRCVKCNGAYRHPTAAEGTNANLDALQT